MLIPTVAFFSPIARDELISHLLDGLKSADFVVHSEDDVDSIGPLDTSLAIVFIGTGGTEQLVASFADGIGLSSVILLAHSSNNSLPAAMEIRAYLEEKGVEAEIRQGSLAELHETIQAINHHAKLLAALRGMRLGIVGEPSSWLIASQIDKSAVQTRWGIEIVEIPFSRLESIEPIGENEISGVQMKPGETHVEDAEVRAAYEIGLKLMAIKRSENLDAVTLECFRLVESTDVTGCLALATLNSLGIPSGCEGDIPATFTMLLAKMLTDNISFMANVIEVDEAENSIVLAHCTVPFALVEDYDFQTHYETDKSVGIQGRFPESDVTMLKISGDDLSQYWMSEGVIEENLSREEACRTQIKVRLDSPVEYFLEDSLANHHVLIPGLHGEDIRTFLEYVLKS